MTELREMFASKADEVTGYNVADQVIRGARRRRRAQRVAPVAAGLVAVLVIAGILTSGNSDSDVPIVAADQAASSGSLSWLPSTITPPASAPPPLPTDRAVGPGSLLYRTCASGCPTRLIAADGRQFSLPAYQGTTPDIPQTPTLSPDGRWLSYPNADGRYVLRDLTSDHSVSTGSRRTVGWSPDSSRLALADASSENDVAVVALPELAKASQAQPTGVKMPLPADEQRVLAGIANDGSAIFGANQIGRVGGPTNLRVVEPGGDTYLVNLTNSQNSSSGEDPMQRPVLTADGSAILQQLLLWRDGERDSEGSPGDVLRLDLSGTTLSRLRLPTPVYGARPPSTGSNNDGGPVGGQTRTLVASLPEGAVLVHWNGARPASLELLDPTTGKRTVVCELSADVAWVGVRGSQL